MRPFNFGDIKYHRGGLFSLDALEAGSIKGALKDLAYKWFYKRLTNQARAVDSAYKELDQVKYATDLTPFSKLESEEEKNAELSRMAYIYHNKLLSNREMKSARNEFYEEYTDIAEEGAMYKKEFYEKYYEIDEDTEELKLRDTSEQSRLRMMEDLTNPKYYDTAQYVRYQNLLYEAHSGHMGNFFLESERIQDYKKVIGEEAWNLLTTDELATQLFIYYEEKDELIREKLLS